MARRWWLIVALFLVVLATAAAVVVPALLTAKDRFKTEQDHLLPVRTDVEALLTGATDQETGLRGYAATHDRAFLEPYQLGAQAVSAARARLEGDSLPGPTKADLARAVGAYDGWDQYATAQVARVSGGATPTTADDVEGKQRFDAFRAGEARLAGDVDAAVGSAGDRVVRTIELALGVLAGVLALGTLVMLGSLWFGRRWARADRDADRSIRAASRRAEIVEHLAVSLSSVTDRSQLGSFVGAELAAGTGAGALALGELDDREGRIEWLAAHGLPAQLIAAHSPLPVSTGTWAGMAVRSKDPVIARSPEELQAAGLQLRGPLASAEAGGVWPLTAGTATLGVLAAIWTSPGALGPDETVFMSTVAGLVAQAIARIRVIEANEELAASRGRTARLLAAILDATSDPIFAKGIDGRYLVANHAARRALTSDGVDDIVGRTAQEFWPPEVASEIDDHDRAVMEEGVERRLEETVVIDGEQRLYSSVKAPLRDEHGGVVGMVGIARDVTDQMAALAVLERVYQVEHDLAGTIQATMRGNAVAPDDRVEVAAWYRPSTEELMVGGDWFDVIDLDDGRIGLAAGDIVGHDVASATAMGQLRSALVGIAHTGVTPAQALQSLERFAAAYPGAHSATCLYATIDPWCETIRWASAGQVPLLLAAPDGRTTFLEVPQGPPLVAGAVGRLRAEGEAALSPGTVIVAYTDGIVERRSESLDVGLERLSEAVGTRARLPAATICDEVVRALVGDEVLDDDAGLVVIKLVDARPRTFRRTVPALPGAVHDLRHELRRWLAPIGDDASFDIELAVSEALSNSAEHAYCGRPSGVVALQARHDGSTIDIDIVDHGSWRPSAADPVRGHGLGIMRSMMDDVTVTTQPSHTTVHLRKVVPSTGGAT